MGPARGPALGWEVGSCMLDVAESVQLLGSSAPGFHAHLRAWLFFVTVQLFN